MKKILLHIGMPKTGSTALQSFFFDNRENLARKGIGLYIPEIRGRARNIIANGSFINDLTISGRDKTDWFVSEQESFQRYAQLFDTILLSEELIWLYSFYYDNYWRDAKSIIEELVGQDIIICPIVYIRRQDEWAFSWWKESTRIANPIDSYFQEFVSHIQQNGMLYYDIWLEELESVFGKDNIMLRIYDREEFEDSSIFRDFLNFMNIEESGFIVNDTIINPSITTKAAYAAITIHRGHFKYGMATVSEVENLREATRIFSQKFPEREEYYPISIDERMKILDICATSNNKIAKKYFDRDVLFSTEINPYTVVTPDYKKDIENARSIVKLARAVEYQRRYR